jgi:hypothetical protein
VSIVISNASTVRFINASLSGNTISFSVEYDNNSGTNTHTYRLENPSGTTVRSGNIAPSSTRTINYSETFSSGFTGTFIAEKFGPNGGNLGTAVMSFTTPSSPPPPPTTPAPVFSDATVASPAIRGVSYTDGVTANNTNSYSVFSGALPAGLELNTSTGAITGTPTTLGTSTFVIRATGNGGNTNTDTLTILVNPPAPAFSDQTITTSWIKTRNFDVAPDRTVAASDVASYSIVYSGSGLNPTSWLTINSSGQLSGLPPALGAYTFVIRATNVTGSTDSSLKTITINPPGNRRDGTNFQTDMILTKRYTGTQWVNVTTFKRYNGTSWVDIVN